MGASVTWVKPDPTTGIDKIVGGIDNALNVTSRSAAFTPLGDQQITIATLAAVQTLTIPPGATVAIIQNNTTQAMRFRDRPDGTAPTATLGQRIAAGAPYTYDGDLTKFKMIREADGTGTVDIAYYS